MRNQARTRHREISLDRDQVLRFVATLFDTSDLIELRAIETWSRDGKKSSQLVDRFWLTPRDFDNEILRLERLNSSANIFFGVNPRIDQGGTKCSVGACRSVWVDLDNISPEAAGKRWQRINLPPTVVVHSGHGIHAYWKLDDPISMKDPARRAHLESVVKAVGESLKGDTTHDCSRLLRLPGTWNMKDVRNGRQPVECTIVSLDASRIYPLSTFESLLAVPVSGSVSAGEHRTPITGIANINLVSLCTATHGTSRDHRRIQGVLRYLDRDLPDRSRRDLGAVRLLIQAGLSKAEVRSLVMNHSKFLEAGDTYFERTYDAALRSLGQ